MALKLGENVKNNMNHFRIVIQPMVSAENGKLVGGEVLLRWNFQGKDISPMVFISLLEKDDTIQSVGRWVFEQAVAACSRIRSYNPEFFLTFNVSLHQLSDKKLPDFMNEILNKYHLDGSGMVAELTEECFDEQPEKLIYFINECQKMGIRIALDDFGSGYSSLKMMLQNQYEIIKLDRSLIQEAMESEEKRSFIRSIIFACHQFGKSVCAEGVEQSEQEDIVRDMGCDLIQGFYRFCPVELKDIYLLVAENNSVR